DRHAASSWAWLTVRTVVPAPVSSRPKVSTKQQANSLPTYVVPYSPAGALKRPTGRELKWSAPCLQVWRRYQLRPARTVGSLWVARSAGGGGSGPRSAGLAPTLLSVVSGRVHHVCAPTGPQPIQRAHAVQPRLTGEQVRGLAPGVQVGQHAQ